MSDEPSSPPDLATIDLSLSFVPAWAKETDSGDRLAKLAAKHGAGDRPERAGGGKWQDRGPRSDRKPPRRDGGGPRPGGSGRPERRDGRREEQRPERPKPEPGLTGWEVQFMPDRHGVDGLAKQIKTSAKAYPLFDLARLVLEKSERYLVGFKRTAETATPLFQLKSDGSLWLNEAEAVAHALATQLDKFYRRERVSVDPPKGAYPFVAVCGMSGVLLGPPNYHDYQTKIRQLHAERFANMPFEAFKSRIRMERDEAMIEKWKEEQSSRDVFYPIDPAEAEKPAPSPVAAKPAAETTPAPTPEEPAASPEGTAAVTEELESPAPAVEEVAAPASEAIEPATEPSEPAVDAGEVVAEDVAPPTDDAKKLASLSEVERHFRENHAAKAVVRIRDRVMVPGPAALNESAPAVLRLTRGAWEELEKFPLPLAHILGQQLAAKGVQIFKTHDNITHVGVARPRHLDVVATPVSDALRTMLEYIEAHRSVPRAEQWKALVELRPAPEGGSEVLRETAAAADLFWLLREGHVIDYAKRGLEAARKPKPNTPKAPKPPRSEKAPAPAKAPEPVQEARPPEEPAPMEPAPVETASVEPAVAEPVSDEAASPETPSVEPVESVATIEEAVSEEIPPDEPAPVEVEEPAPAEHSAPKPLPADLSIQAEQ